MSDKLSGYDTSTTARSSRGSSSSSTDSLASWSSREARDREGEVRPAGLVGEVRPAGLGVNSNGEEGRRVAPLGNKALELLFPQYFDVSAIILIFRARERNWGPSGC